MRVLLNTVRLSKEGGVANYYNVIQPYFVEDVEYFTIGARTDVEKPLRGLFRLLLDYWNFTKKLSKNNFDLVHINPSLLHKAVIRDGIYLLIAKLFNKKTLVFFRGWNLHLEKVIRKYFLPLFRFVYKRTDTFVVLSSEFKDTLINMGFRQPIFLETTIVDDAVFTRCEAETSRKGDSDCPRFNILFLARIEKAKGIYEALDTYKILKARHPHITMTIAGEGAEHSKARQYADNLITEGIEFTGYLRGDAKHEAFIRADAYFLPSWGEGMPNSLIEAMAYGLPIITRPEGGIRNFFVDGGMGFLTDSKDPSVYAGLLEKLIEDRSLRMKIGEYNRHYAREHFMASNAAKRIESIYRSVIECKV